MPEWDRGDSWRKPLHERGLIVTQPLLDALVSAYWNRDELTLIALVAAAQAAVIVNPLIQEHP